MRIRRLVRGMIGASLLAGCAGLPDPFQDPQVRLDHVMLQSVGLTGGTMDLVVGVHNPNNFDLKGTRLQIGFDVEDSHVGDLEYQDAFGVQKGDSTMLTLPVRFTWSGLAGAVRTALGYGELPYKIQGQLTVATPLGDRKVPFTREGRAPLTRGAGLLPIPTGQ